MEISSSKERDVVFSQIINPNCSEIVAKLPCYERIVKAKTAKVAIHRSNMSKTIKQTLCNVLEEYVYDTVVYVPTDSYPNDARGNMQWTADDFIKHGVPLNEIPPLLYVDNNGGGGHWDLVEQSWDLAKLNAAGVLTEEEANEWEEKLWTCSEDIKRTEQCTRCLEGEPDAECPDAEKFLKRLVGECKGIPGKTYGELFTELSENAHHVKEGGQDADQEKNDKENE